MYQQWPKYCQQLIVHRGSWHASREETVIEAEYALHQYKIAASKNTDYLIYYYHIEVCKNYVPNFLIAAQDRRTDVDELIHFELVKLVFDQICNNLSKVDVITKKQIQMAIHAVDCGILLQNIIESLKARPKLLKDSKAKKIMQLKGSILQYCADPKTVQMLISEFINIVQNSYYIRYKMNKMLH
jgi:hypothetical protein